MVVLDDAEFYHEMPIGLQIVGRRFEDEKVIAVAKFLRDKLGTKRSRRPTVETT